MNGYKVEADSGTGEIEESTAEQEVRKSAQPISSASLVLSFGGDKL